MNKLRPTEIEFYLTQENDAPLIDVGISRQYLESLDLDGVRPLVKIGNTLREPTSGVCAYHRDTFTPRVCPSRFKPSFRGEQYLMGRQDRTLFFSRGEWFPGGNTPPLDMSKVIRVGGKGDRYDYIRWGLGEDYTYDEINRIPIAVKPGRLYDGTVYLILDGVENEKVFVEEHASTFIESLLT